MHLYRRFKTFCSRPNDGEPSPASRTTDAAATERERKTTVDPPEVMSAGSACVCAHIRSNRQRTPRGEKRPELEGV